MAVAVGSRDPLTIHVGGGPGEITDSGSLKCLDLVCFGDKINPILTYPFNDLMEIRKRSIKVKHSRGVFICQ